jgi:hypothetical protein
VGYDFDSIEPRKKKKKYRGYKHGFERRYRKTAKR